MEQLESHTLLVIVKISTATLGKKCLAISSKSEHIHTL